MRLGLYGFGQVNRLVARVALSRGHEIVGVVDIDPSLQGKDAGELAGVGKIGVPVTRDVDDLSGADVVVHATGSFLDRVLDQLLAVVEMGIDVVSTCETLAFPYRRYPVLSRLLDQAARDYGVAVLGAGVNPGFIFDVLPALLSATVPRVERLEVVRSLDAAKRRESFRRKIGVGEDPAVVKQKLERGEITGHVGYAESVYLIAAAGGLELDRVVEEQGPYPAEEPVESHGVRVEKGMNRGIVGRAAGYARGREVISVELRAYVGAPDFDEVVVEGDGARVAWRSTGTHGDLATASLAVGAAEAVVRLPPGLRLLTELLPYKMKFAV